MNTKEDILKKVASGLLTVEEGLRLLDKISPNQNTVEFIVDQLFDAWENEDGEEELVFDYPNVLKYYCDTNWKWADTPDGIQLKDLKKFVEYLATTVIKGMKEQIENGEEVYFTCGSGGLEMVGYEDEDGKYRFNLRFVPVNGEAVIEKNELI